jgi:hypothetical protein
MILSQVAKLKVLSCVPFVGLCLGAPCGGMVRVTAGISGTQPWAARVRRTQLKVVHFVLDMLESTNVRVRHAGVQRWHDVGLQAYNAHLLSQTFSFEPKKTQVRGVIAHDSI